MLLTALTGTPVVFVGGKGGVGKTTIASALARAAAERGQRVQLVSTDPAHNLGHVWGCAVGDPGTRLWTAPLGSSGRVDGVEIDAAATTERHLAAVAGTVRRMLPAEMHAQAEQHLALARDAPGSHEAATLERVADAVARGRGDFDLTVFDTAPTGHTLRLLSLPRRLLAWSEGLLDRRTRADRFAGALRGIDADGAAAGVPDRDRALERVLTHRRDRFAELAAVLGDAERARFVLVTTAERIPLVESRELAAELRRIGVAVGGVVLNRLASEAAGEAGRPSDAEYGAALRALRAELPGVPLSEVPAIAGGVHGDEGLRALGAWL
ncbi:ArsA family ATPase [Leucobacter chromiireducens]|uniref:ArsA family ATPase n=1 Tax=Leucobacter chromiireducens TaxID=283877 RepID=UPI001F149FD8|nr:ArsA family ATPase [Leucobacter chromiireducens]